MRDPEGAWGFSPTKNAPLIEGRALAPGLPLMNAANRKGPRIGVPGKLARWGERLDSKMWDRATEIAADSQENVAQLYFEIIFSHYEISIDVHSRASMLLRCVCSGRTEANTPCCTAHIIAAPSLVAKPRPIHGDAAWPPRGRSLPRHLQRAFP